MSDIWDNSNSSQLHLAIVHFNETFLFPGRSFSIQRIDVQWVALASVLRPKLADVDIFTNLKGCITFHPQVSRLIQNFCVTTNFYVLPSICRRRFS